MFSCTSLPAAASATHAGCLCNRPEIHALTRRINLDLSRRGFLAGAAAATAAAGLPARARAQAAPAAPAGVLFTNVRLFDGRSPTLRQGMRLHVEGNRIKAIGEGDGLAPEGAATIDCGGRVLMPGLIDAHWHTFFAALPVTTLLAGDTGFIAVAAGAEAERTLLRGFTTVRDLGGPAFPLKQAIDQGIVPGPRIYPSGAMITATGGHGDLRPLTEIPRGPGDVTSVAERSGAAAIVDGPDEIRLRVREQLMQGASQIKIVGGGGVSTPRSPLDLTTLTEAEVRAAVEVAEDWNTFVTVHAYTSRTVQRAIAAGARCIEHAHLMDEETAEMMAEKGVWLSIQPFLSGEDTGALAGPSLAASLQVFAGTDTAYGLAKKHGIRTAFGSDLLFSQALATRQGTMLTHLSRWYSNAEALTMATATNAELLAMSGPRNPYPGKLGVIDEGALADLLVVDGNPLDDLMLLADPGKNLSVIMKDGAIHKNALPS